ncbi:sensor histidine kinase [Staphylococcus devriesei]|uniref:histidine kinase n=1 Tax=Staphylococcus devriesei TaxID=586733 RepID=A0ABX5I3N8_9STAP|nr:sensor histidine kinase [Staphylococcus devriesei]MCE5097081.1 sensor histidine kinase [Staphylococcus devriesei]PNZ88129.1 sensor histidine kinase [Staphylococcus devriesei]PTF14872.1 sensor histidine kinase [Staphylococcus devriesei]PTF19082.1 sensor histidine kinase [Staphylococcus devriesei]SUM02598.1 two-component sensor histidine kinase [Staphylococcus devriesei]
MLKAFIKSIVNELIIIVITLLLFGLIFFLFDLPFGVFFLGAAIIAFVMVIYWLVKLSGFIERENLKETKLELEQELQRVKSTQTDYQANVESYFLTWVHQIKTPITASKLLLERNEDNVVNRVRQEIIQIDNYTSLALSYLKLMNQETDMSFSKVTINELVRPLIMKYSIQFIDQKTKIHYDRCEAEVLTDVQWCTIMIEQLLNNALKYARGKDIWITFDSDTNALSIRDNGVGISQADLPKIFDKGYSGYNGRLNDKSSGIGLFIVKHISRHLHHKVDVQSELGKGTRFSIHFPHTT